MWKETEQELDLLEAATKPRTLNMPKRLMLHRASHSHINVSVIEPPCDSVPDSRVYLAYSPEKPVKAASGSPKVFVNLPKLPFGSHKSYNEEGNIRALIVSKRWKAWRREGRLPLKRKEDPVNSTMC